MKHYLKKKMGARNLDDKELTNLAMVLGYSPEQIRREYNGTPWRTHGDITRLLLDRLQPAVAEQINGLLTKTYKSPFTGHILPLRKIGDDEPISFRWNTFSYEQGIANEVEQEGLARLHSSTKTEHGARMVRRGLAIKIEENFYRTNEGMEKYRQQLEQMATSILRTHEMDIMLSLLQSPAVNVVRTKDDANQIYGLDIHLRPEDRLKRQVDCFGMVNKNNEMGMTNLTAFLIGQMRNKGVNPDTIIVPPYMMSYYNATTPSLHNYSEAGPSSTQAREIAAGVGMGENGFRRDEFNGLRVVDTLVQRMVEGSQQHTTELLTVPKQIGEFYPMLTRYAVEERNSFEKYHSKLRNVHIYDEDLDRIVRVEYADAVKHCRRWNDDGTIDTKLYDGIKDDLFINVEGKPVKYWGDMTKKWLSDESISNTVLTIRKMLQLSDEDITTFKEFLVVPDVANGAAAPTASTDRPERKKMLDKFQQVLKKVSKYLQACGTAPKYFNELLKDVLPQNTDALFSGPTLPSRVSRICPKLIESPVDCVLTFLFLCTQITRDSILNMHRLNIYIPIDFILARPYMTYRASSVIILKAGSNTGETLISQERFQMTCNVADRMLYSNIFYYSKAIVKNPRNVIIAPNVFIQMYMYGNNTKFIQDEKDFSQIREDGGLVYMSTASMLSFATCVNDDVYNTNVIDIRGENKEIEFERNKKMHYMTASFYSQRLNVRDERINSVWSNHQDYENDYTEPNTICMLGHMEDSEHNVIFYNTGHLGRVTVDGIGTTRKPGMYGSKALVHLTNKK